MRLFFLITLFLPVRLLAANYIGVEDGLSNRYVTCILQDHVGLMWVGTTNGLNVYDGYSFKSYFTYSPDLKLSNSRINGIVEDQAGNLWVATDRGLNRISADRTSNRIPDELKTRNICSLRFLPDSTLLLGTTDGEILQIITSSMKVSVVYREGREIAINGLQTDRGGNIWFITNSEKKIYKLSAAFKPDLGFLLADAMSSNYIIVHDSLVLASRKGDGIRAFSVRNAATENALDFLNKQYGKLSLLYQDKSGMVWMAGPGGVVVRVNINTNTVTDYSHLFNRAYFGSDIKSFYEDQNGMMWVGTDGGLVRVATSSLPFRSYLRNTDLATKDNFISTRGMLEGDDKSVYIGSYMGLYQLRPNGETSRHVLANGEIPAPFQMVNYGQHRILMTTVTNGLLIFNTATRQFEQAIPHPGRSDNQLYALYLDSDGTIWTGTRNKGLKIFDPKNKQLLPYLDRDTVAALGQSFVLSIAEYPRGIIWVGTNKGLLRIDKASRAVKQYNLQTYPGMTNEEILCVTPDKQHHLWLGSRGGGVMRLDLTDDSMTYWNTTEGLSSNIVYGIIKDTSYLWLSTENGISRFHPETGQFKNYYQKDGLNNNEFNTASHLKTCAGEIYFGGIDGVNSFIPSTLGDKQFTGRIVLTSLKRDNTELSSHQSTPDFPIVLPSDDRNISLQFALTDYYRPEANTFYYRIVGIDPDWVNLGAQNFLRISQMPAGDYELLIRGKNANDQFSVNQISIRLHVEQVFYKQLWFIALVVVAGLLILYSFFRLRLNQLVTMQHLRTKIASDLHDEVGSMLTRISILTEVLKYKNTDQEEIGQIAAVSRQATATMSDVLWSVDARNDKIGNLVDRLREHADSLLLPLHISVQFESKLDQNKPLDMQTRQNVLLIFKEAIHNIAKHAEASEVNIQLAMEKSSFMMTVRDNGKNASIKNGTGQGLKNMLMRAKEIGGELYFESTTGFVVVFRKEMK